MRVIYLCCLLLCTQVQAQADVIFFNPGTSEESFWGDVDSAISEAATQLGVDLKITHGNRDRLVMIDKIQSVILSGALPKYVLLVNEAGSGTKILKSLYGLPIYVSFMLNDISQSQRARLINDPHWRKYLLPAVIPDNYFIGKVTAEALVKAITDESPEIIGISGDTKTPASKERTLGATEYFSSQQVSLHQTITAQWREDIAYRKTLTMLSRYPNLNGIWTGNDHMALGVIKALEDRKLIPGEDVFISSINTSRAIMALREQGKVVALGGGHFLTGALVLHKICQHQQSGQFSSALPFPLFSLLEPGTPLYRALVERDWSAVIGQKFNFSARDHKEQCFAI